MERVIKRLITLALLTVILSLNVCAQQTSLVSHYFYHPYLINPARTGQTKEAQAFLLYRQQWVGMPGAPETHLFTLDGPVNGKLGVGLLVNSDVTNIIARTAAKISSSYLLKLTESQSLSFGMSMGVLRTNLRFDQVRADISDDGLLLNADNRTTLDGSAGLSYAVGRFRAGFISEQLFNQQLEFQHTTDNRSISYALVRHYLVTAQYRFQLNARVAFEPLLVLRSAQGLPPQWDANAWLSYDDNGWLNVQYRHRSGVAATLGGRISNRFIVSYQYELPTSALKSATAGSHEVMVGMRFVTRPGNATTPRPVNRKAMDEIRRENSAQYEKLDEIQQRNEDLNRQLMEYKKLVDEQNDEIQKLKNSISSMDDEVRQMIADSQVDLQKEESFDSDFTYYIIIGATRTLAEAKDFEKIIRRETRLKPEVIQNDAKTWYFIHTEEVKSSREAREKMRQLELDRIAHLIIGNPWIYKSKNR